MEGRRCWFRFLSYSEKKALSMSGEGRASTIAKLIKVAKKHYPVVKPPAGRGVLDNLLYACLLEDSNFTAADDAFAKLEQYCDWNEVRVSTVAELSEVLTGLGKPEKAAERLKNALHSVFETHYSYDLDFLIKESQGKAIAQLEKYIGIGQFVVSYVVQNSFSGHKIPICEATLELAHVLGLVTPKERESGNIPGLDRAVSKTKGVEFFSTVHQMAVAYFASPFSTDVRKILTEVASDASERMKKRAAKPKAQPAPNAESKSEGAKALPKDGKAKTAVSSGTEPAKPSKKSAKTTTKKATPASSSDSAKTAAKPASKPPKKATPKIAAASAAPAKKASAKKEPSKLSKKKPR